MDLDGRWREQFRSCDERADGQAPHNNPNPIIWDCVRQTTEFCTKNGKLRKRWWCKRSWWMMVAMVLLTCSLLQLSFSPIQIILQRIDIRWKSIDSITMENNIEYYTRQSTVVYSVGWPWIANIHNHSALLFSSCWCRFFNDASSESTIPGTPHEDDALHGSP